MRVSREVKAALAYYGFTPSHDSLPRGMSVERVEDEGDEALGERLLRAVKWSEHTGRLSRVPRLSPRDVAALLGVSEEDALRAMFGAAKRGRGLAVLRITYRGEERYLLVKVV